jgi:hypothetical protein
MRFPPGIFLYFFFCAALISGCATSQVYLDRAIIRNETRGVISEVRVRHEPTGKIGEVHSILAHSTFELGFSPGPMLAKKSTVSWKSQNGEVNSVELELPRYQPGNKKDRALVLIYTIHPDGIVTVALEE